MQMNVEFHLVSYARGRHQDCALTLVVKKLPAQLCPLDMGGQLLVCLLNHALLIVGLLESFKGVTFNDKMKELRNC